MKVYIVEEARADTGLTEYGDYESDILCVKKTKESAIEFIKSISLFSESYKNYRGKTESKMVVLNDYLSCYDYLSVDHVSFKRHADLAYLNEGYSFIDIDHPWESIDFEYHYSWYIREYELED